MTTPHQRKQIDFHFLGDLSTRDEAKMRAHLGDCSDCRVYYEQHLMLAELDPRALTSEDRLGRALSIRASRSWLRPILVAAPALAILLVVATFALRPSSEFTARGGATPTAPQLLVFHRDAHDGRVEAVKQTIRRADELAFSYRNAGGLKHLMIFGVDEHQHVYWYYPAWTDPVSNPAAVSIDKTLAARELPDAISQPLAGSRLTIYGLFTDRAPTVHEIEAAFKSAPPTRAGDELVHIDLEIRP